MAKGLRSKSKGRSRAILRQKVFQSTIDERTVRLAKLQADAADKPKVSSGGDEDMDAAAALDEELKTDEEPKKVSTSGPRNKKQARYLEKKKIEKKKKAKKGMAIFKK
ncbi:hypothetical protein INT44_003976 [Umbelopsis vinacea]|uniref:DUF2423 domain-containing protein n=1 Tax=Umbelopsis vinacea TaxID=44442 RepID=A0A8H7QCF0_9FUNG|nr:hypothetical protein INT44_003976 [Umbelopsis vinacea]KAI9286902.1 hypothetical protein BC943DRAFT_320224 [Umbelopsis sp. AD052]